MHDNTPLILLVDDEPELTAVFGDKLGSSGFRVARAESGKDALALAREERPDAVLLDLRMPEMDGAAFLDVFRKDPDFKDIPVAILTSFHEYEGEKVDDQYVSKIGANVLFEKGMDLSELVRRVRALIAGS